MAKRSTPATPTEEPLKRITVIVGEDTHARLKSLCATHRIAMMEATRVALEDYVRVLEKRKPPTDRRRKQRAVAAEMHQQVAA